MTIKSDNKGIGRIIKSTWKQYSIFIILLILFLGYALVIGAFEDAQIFLEIINISWNHIILDYSNLMLITFIFFIARAIQNMLVKNQNSRGLFVFFLVFLFLTVYVNTYISIKENKYILIDNDSYFLQNLENNSAFIDVAKNNMDYKNELIIRSEPLKNERNYIVMSFNQDSNNIDTVYAFVVNNEKNTTAINPQVLNKMVTSYINNHKGILSIKTKQ